MPTAAMRKRARPPSMRRRSLPSVFALVKARGNDPGVELDVLAQIELVGDVVQVPLGFGLPREMFLPVPFPKQLFRKGISVRVALRIESCARIAVPIQVPPTPPPSSYTRTVRPISRNLYNSNKPETPAPIMIASNRSTPASAAPEDCPSAMTAHRRPGPSRLGRSHDERPVSRRQRFGVQLLQRRHHLFREQAHALLRQFDRHRTVLEDEHDLVGAECIGEFRGTRDGLVRRAPRMALEKSHPKRRWVVAQRIRLRAV